MLKHSKIFGRGKNPAYICIINFDNTHKKNLTWQTKKPLQQQHRKTNNP